MNNFLLAYNNEIFRKIIHLTSLIIPLTYYLSTYIFFITILSFITLIILLINNNYLSIISHSRYIKLFFTRLLRNYEFKEYWGASYLVIGFLCISIFFDKNIVIISMIITSICDSLAAIVGIKYGKLKLSNNKSIEGFYIFLISTYIILFVSFEITIFYIFIISSLIALVELFTPTKYDNLTIPIASTLILTLFKI